LESLTCLVLVLACMIPPLALEWLFASAILRREWRAIAFTVVAATLYLGCASIVAVRNDIWLFDEDKITALHGGGFVFEAWLFSLLANTVIAQAAVVGMDESVRQRVRQRLRR
jgi:lycopene cyclase domain-containing protein